MKFSLQIFLNGNLHQKAQSAHIAKTILKNVDTRRRLYLAIQTEGSGGLLSDMVELEYESGEEEESHSNTQNAVDNDVYKTGRKRLVSDLMSL